MSITELDISGIAFDDIDLTDSKAFATGFPTNGLHSCARTRRCGGRPRPMDRGSGP